MIKDILPNDFKFRGPWLLSKDNLRDLEKTILEIWDILQLVLKEDVAKEIKSKKTSDYIVTDGEIVDYIDKVANKSYYKKNLITIEIGVKKQDYKKSYDAMKDLINDLTLKNEQVTSVQIDIVSFNNSILVNIERNLYGEDLKFSVIAESNIIKQDILAKLNEWREKCQPKKITKIWGCLYGFRWTLIILFMFLTSIIFSSSSYKKEAHRLIEEGINESNLVQAITILLKITSGYESSTTINLKGLMIWLIMGFIMIALSFVPRTTIGLGKGEISVKHWATWIKIVTYIVPSSIILPLIINLITR